MAREEAFVPEIEEDFESEDSLEMVERQNFQSRCRSHADLAVHALAEVASGVRRSREPNEDGFFPPELDEDGMPIPIDTTPAARAQSANKLLEHGHGRPSQNIRDVGVGSNVAMLVVVHRLMDGTTKVIPHKREEIDVTPTREQIAEGSASAERVEAPELPA